jgi:hypothetical protein
MEIRLGFEWLLGCIRLHAVTERPGAVLKGKARINESLS